jgi:hypothetical protein
MVTLLGRKQQSPDNVKAVTISEKTRTNYGVPKSSPPLPDDRISGSSSTEIQAACDGELTGVSTGGIALSTRSVGTY